MIDNLVMNPFSFQTSEDFSYCRIIHAVLTPPHALFYLEASQVSSKVSAGIEARTFKSTPNKKTTP